MKRKEGRKKGKEKGREGKEGGKAGQVFIKQSKRKESRNWQHFKNRIQGKKA